MFNCATTKSADTSSRYVAESSVKSESPNDRIEKLERIKKDLIIIKEGVEEYQKLNKEKEQALKAAEEARKKKDEAAKREEQARQEKEQACKGMYNALMEMKELCKKGDKENCEDYKECLPQYEEMCGKK